MAEQILPNYLGIAQNAYAFGQQQGAQKRGMEQRSRLAALAQQAYGAAPDQRDVIMQQAVGVDHEAGLELSKGLRGEEDAREQALLNTARMIDGAPPEMKEAIYQQVRPRIGQYLPNLPDAYNDQVGQGIKAFIASRSTGQGGMFSQKVGEDGFIYNTDRNGNITNTGVKADRQMWLRDHPGMPPELVDKSGAIRPVGVPQPVAGGGEVPFMVDPNLPTEVQADIRANEGRGQAWTGQQPVPATRAMARPSEGQTAAAVEAAKSATELQYLPEAERIKRESAIAQARGIADVKREAELAEQAPKRVKQYEQALQASKNVMTSIDKALGMIGPLSTGFIGARSRGIEGSPAYNLAAEIETVKANLGFDRLQQMRDNSPTGGALGAIAVQELIALQSTIANLDPNQGDEQLRQNLERVQTHYRNWQNAVQQALADENRQAAPVAPQQGRTALPPGFSWED